MSYNHNFFPYGNPYGGGMQSFIGLAVPNLL